MTLPKSRLREDCERRAAWLMEHDHEFVSARTSLEAKIADAIEEAVKKNTIQAIWLDIHQTIDGITRAMVRVEITGRWRVAIDEIHVVHTSHILEDNGIAALVCREDEPE